MSQIRGTSTGRRRGFDESPLLRSRGAGSVSPTEKQGRGPCMPCQAILKLRVAGIGDADRE